ncbi:MAG: hypothetical protein MJZ24_07220 [Paludibacteraceae bacterium]|nr:hypothetical protein [Paludibacteraceae bacterium]
MKYYSSLLLLFALGISACSNTPSSTNNEPSNQDAAAVQEPLKNADAGNELKIEWAQNAKVAVAYLGGYASFEKFKGDGRYEKMAEDIAILKNFNGFTVDAQGYETYLIVPRDAQAKVVVSEFTMEMATKEKAEDSGATYYKSENGSPILVKGNISEICPNMKITITNSNGETIKFQPQLSMENGKLSCVEGMQDFSPAAAYQVTGSPVGE